MTPLCLSCDDIVYEEMDEWIRLAEARHTVHILFAGVYGSRPMRMDTPVSDYDIYAVHASPIQERRVFTLEHDSQRCDVISWPATMVMPAPAVTGAEKAIHYPSYDFRSAAQQEIRRSLPPAFEPQEHVAEILLFRQVWDKRGYLQAHWSKVRSGHLNKLRTLDLLYSKAKGLWDNYLQGKHVLVRRYLNAVHRVLGLLWILERNTVPPIAFDELLESCTDAEMLWNGRSLLKAYRQQTLGKDAIWMEPDFAIHHYLSAQLAIISSAIASVAEHEHERSLDARLVAGVGR